MGLLNSSPTSAYLDDFWKRSDIQIKPEHPAQCLRWNLFQLLQASGQADQSGIPAKGLTSQTYDWHYFWDMEMYVLPFLIYTSPRLAADVLQFRYGILDKARERARAVSQKGALFAWRTISGEERRRTTRLARPSTTSTPRSPSAS